MCDICIYIDIYTYVDIIGTNLSQKYFQGSNAPFLGTCPGIQRPPFFLAQRMMIPISVITEMQFLSCKKSSS